jgi:NAD(P)-dependent dehydrogenase (short-subunit alcohol dehydrogenase family)
MPAERIALVTGANQGVGREVATKLAEAGVTVYVGSRDLARGEAAAAEIGHGATALQIDVTDLASIAAAAAALDEKHGRLDLLVSNAGISNVGGADQTPEQNAARSTASTASLDEIRAVWDVNVFGTLAVYQAMLPLLRRGVDARIVTVSSGVGSLASNADPAFPYRSYYGPVYPASKAAENALVLAMMIELEDTDIKINLVSPGFTSTALNNFSGTESIEDGSREVVRVALLGPDGPTGTFTRWEDSTIPW